MFDSTVAYRTTQVVSSRPIDQVVLLYHGAIRFATIHLGALDRGDLEAAHNASIRSQAIVAGLREVLDLSAGPVAGQLDALYDFIHRRLTEGNTAKDGAPTIEAIELLRGLLEAWQALAAAPAPAPVANGSPSLFGQGARHPGGAPRHALPAGALGGVA
jgi:flagellar secretion chaperone FliS